MFPASTQVVVALASGLEASSADLEARHDALLRAHALTRELYEARRRLRRQQDEAANTEADTATLDERLARAQRGLARLASRIEGSTTRPTADQLRAMERAEADAKALMSAVDSR
jgi:hypothetical protein